MREIKYKVYIKELNNIFDVNTMTFLDEWIRVFIKWDYTRNYLVDWENNFLLEYVWKNTRTTFKTDTYALNDWLYDTIKNSNPISIISEYNSEKIDIELNKYIKKKNKSLD